MVEAGFRTRVTERAGTEAGRAWYACWNIPAGYLRPTGADAIQAARLW